jgi:hypothetical protein
MRNGAQKYYLKKNLVKALKKGPPEVAEDPLKRLEKRLLKSFLFIP